jgi:uncharacterized protein
VVVSDEFLGAWHVWRQEREERLTAPYGYLSITGLHWLTSEPQRFPDVPGEWVLGPDGVEVRLGAGESLAIDGRTLTGAGLLGDVDEAGVQATYGDARLEIARRGASVVLRPRRPDHPARLVHRPTPTYPPSEEWVVRGAFRPYDRQVPLGVETVVDGWRQVEQTSGDVEFLIGGETHRLVAFDDGGDLWILFADATSGVTTYGAGRQLSAAAPAADGTVVLDFNRAFNLPCAYTAFTTCPFPPAVNRLPVSVEAGEKVPD